MHANSDSPRTWNILAALSQSSLLFSLFTYMYLRSPPFSVFQSRALRSPSGPLPTH
ncbi:hypothetical protein BDV12DRAFT_164587 [Aspergillus spectabilis]